MLKSIEGKLSSLSDHEYLLKRAEMCLEKGQNFEAKSWIVTAKSMFPKEFAFCFEAYKIDKNVFKSDEAAAESLTEIMSDFIEQNGSRIEEEELSDELEVCL